MAPVGAFDLGCILNFQHQNREKHSAKHINIPIEGILPAPKAWAFVVMNAKMTQSTSKGEVGLHLRPDEAMLVS